MDTIRRIAHWDNPTVRYTLIGATILLLITGGVITLSSQTTTPRNDQKTHHSSDGMPTDRTVNDTIMIADTRYHDPCRLLPEKDIMSVLGQSGRAFINETYLDSSMSVNEFPTSLPVETSCTYRAVGPNNASVGITVATYASRDDAIKEWNTTIRYDKESATARFNDLSSKIKQFESTKKDDASRALRLIDTISSTASSYQSSGSPRTTAADSKLDGIIFDTHATGFTILRDRSHITLTINSNSKENPPLGNDFSEIDTLSPEQLITRLSRASPFLDTISKNFDNTDISQAPVNTWPREGSIKAYEPCELLSHDVIASTLSKKQSKLVEQKSTPRDITMTRLMNNAYTFPAENICTKSFDMSGSSKWDDKAELTILYSKDKPAAIKLFDDINQIYEGYPEITIDGADKVLFKNRHSLDGNSSPTVPGILFARKGQYVIKITLNNIGRNGQNISYRDDQFTSLARRILSEMR